MYFSRISGRKIKHRLERVATIHSTAIIDPKANLDSSVSVGAYSVIGPDVEIDANTSIAPHVVISGPCRIGKENKIFQFCSIGEKPQDKKYHGEKSSLTIGDRNTIREYTSINRGTELDNNVTTLGNDNWVMAYVHVAHDCTVGSNVIFSNGVTLAGHVLIQDYVVLGGFTLVHQFCRVGKYAFSGMGTALNRDIPPFVMASGNLANSYGLNKEGLKRHGFSSDVVKALHKAYMITVKSRSADKKELESLVSEHEDVAFFVNFLEGSIRGIIR